jgi:hypothetical protein
LVGRLLFVSGCHEEPAPKVRLDDHLTDAEGTPEGPRLHAPYARGARVRLTVHRSRPADGPVRWKLTSSLPRVLGVQRQGAGDFALHAKRAGTSRLTVHEARKPSAALYRTRVDVRVPRLLRLCMLRAGTCRPLRHRAPRLAVGASAVILARAYDGEGTLLHGTGLLDVTHVPDRVAAYRFDGAWRGTVHDALYVSVSDPGRHRLGISSTAGISRGLLVRGVAPHQVAELELYRPSGSSEPRPGTLVRLVVRGYDQGGNPVYGVRPRWTAAERSLRPAGAAIEYAFDPQRRLTVSATFGALTRTKTVRAAPGSLRVIE